MVDQDTHQHAARRESSAFALTEAVVKLCAAFKAGLLRIFEARLQGLYLYGASVFPETKGTGDIDLHAILLSAPTASDISAVSTLKSRIAQEFPPLGSELDAYFILRSQAESDGYPSHQLDPSIRDTSWALHRAHLLAGRCVVLHGIEPRKFMPTPTWQQLEDALRRELEYVACHAVQYPGYAIMNLCRILYSCNTKDVVISKFAASEWAMSHAPAWGNLIRVARVSYTRELLPGERTALDGQVLQFLDFALEQIQCFLDAAD